MASRLVNKHMTRVLARGATNIDTTWLEAVDAWITSESLLPNLIEWASPAFGVIKDGSDKIETVFGLGTTWLSRLGDLKPVTQANCTYEATGLSSKPCWSNSNNGDLLYWGTTERGTIRLDPIRRKHEQGLTVASVYKDNSAFGTNIWGMGQFEMPYLRVSSSGKCIFNVGRGGGVNNVQDQHPTTLITNTTNIVGGTFDGDEAIAYVEGVAGAGDSGYIDANDGTQYGELPPLYGSGGGNQQQYYQMGVGQRDVINNAPTTSTTRTVTGTSGGAIQRMSEIILFDTCLTPTQMASLNTLLRTRY